MGWFGTGKKRHPTAENPDPGQLLPSTRLLPLKPTRSRTWSRRRGVSLVPRISSSGWMAGPEGLRKRVAGGGQESGLYPRALWAPGSCFPPSFLASCPHYPSSSWLSP